jgi:hypothetical protein
MQPEQSPQLPSTTQNNTVPPLDDNQSMANQTTQTPTAKQAPDTEIISSADGTGRPVKNDGLTTTNSITFVLSASLDGVPITDTKNFECSLDGSSFSPCTTPAQFNSLSDGAHILEARSIDNSGNKDSSPTSFKWTVDTTAPGTLIDSAADSNNNTLINGSNTDSTSITFTFSGTDTSVEEDEEVGIDHFECAVDGSPYSTCTSPVQYNSISIGNHVVNIRAQDNAGNLDPSPSSFAWTVNAAEPESDVANNITNTIPPNTDIPDTVITSTTGGNNNIIGNETNTPFTDIRFEFSTKNVKEVDHFECSMDSSDFVQCTSPFIFPILPEGNHEFKVRFVDVSGNTDESPAAFIWDIAR